MNSITTKKGDQGNTRLYSQELVSKSSNRIQTIGEIDELTSSLGLAYAEVAQLNYPSTEEKDFFAVITTEITYIQRALWVVMSEIATLEPKLSRLKNRIDAESLTTLDEKCKRFEDSVKLPNGFVLPGANKVSAYLDFSRAVSRRCEREIVHLRDEGFLSNPHLLAWMNRLSDYLYWLARYSEKGNYRMVRD